MNVDTQCPHCGNTNVVVACATCVNPQLNVVVHYNSSRIELECPICKKQGIIHLHELDPRLMIDIKSLMEDDAEVDRDHQLMKCRNEECDSDVFITHYDSFIGKWEIKCVECNTILFVFQEDDVPSTTVKKEGRA